MNRNAIIADAISRISTALLSQQSDESFYKLLESYGLSDLIPEINTYSFDTLKNGKIILFGDCQMKSEVINGILKTFGIDRKRFEHVPYEEVTNYNFKNLEYNMNYRLILISAVPHKAKGIGNYNSTISWLEENKNVAKTVVFNNLKLSKNNFKKILSEEIKAGYLATG